MEFFIEILTPILVVLVPSAIIFILIVGLETIIKLPETKE
jgi:hypothetical protein